MTIRERQVEDVAVFDIEGRVTIQDGSDAFRDTLQGHIQRGHLKIVLNLQGVPYLDTTGLAEIVRVYTSVTRRGGAMKLVHLTPHVYHVLKITKLLTVFDTFDDEAAAIKSFTQAAV